MPDPFPTEDNDPPPVGIGHPVRTVRESCDNCKRIRSDGSWRYCPWCGTKYELPDLTSFQG